MHLFLLVVALHTNLLATTSAVSSSAKLAEIIDGKEVFVQKRLAKVNDTAQQGETISTTKAKAEVEFSNRTIVRMGNNSQLLVGQCIKLQQGDVLVSGKMSACTQNIVAAVRGTTYHIEFVPDENQELIESLSVIEGEVEVTDLSDPQQPPLRLTAGQKLKAVRQNLRQRLQNLNQREFEELIEGKVLAGFQRKLANRAQIARALQGKFPRSRLLRRLR
jgi:molybdopterin converting factor small subunit